MSQLPGNDLLAQIEQENPKLGQYLRQYLGPAITTTAKNAGVSPTGSVASPTPPSAVNVTSFGEMVHVSHEDNSPVKRAINYFTEIGVDDPNFNQPIVYHHGASRTPPPFPLPSLISGGGSPVSHKYYFQGYSQYVGGPPSAKVKFNNGAAITLTGSTVGTPLPSTGSGTASGNGTQGAQGFGKSPVRL